MGAEKIEKSFHAGLQPEYSLTDAQEASEESTKINLESFSPEVLTSIFLFLPFKILLALSLVNHHIGQSAEDNVLWKMKFEEIFPNLFKELVNKSKINWRYEFLSALDSEIKLWPKNQQQLAIAIVRTDITTLQETELNTILDSRNKKQTSLLDLAKKIRNQPVLDYLYQQIKKKYLSPQGEVLKETDEQGKKLFYWFLICNQELDEFVSLNTIADITNQLDKPCSGDGLQLIHLAASLGLSNLVAKILGYRPDLLESKDINNRTALSWAAANGHSKLVKYLIGLNARVDAAINDGLSLDAGLTPLHWAAQGGYAEVVELLINAKANVNVVTTTYGHSTLHYAAKSGNAAVVKLLLDAGVHANTPSHFRKHYPLHYAAEQGHVDIVRLFLAAGANVNAKTNDNVTPLILAMVFNHVEVARQLIAAGAEISAGDLRLSLLISSIIPYLSNMVSYDDHILRVEQLSTIVVAHLSDNADLSRLKLITVLGHLDIVKLILEVQPDLIRQGDDFYQTILLAVQARNTPLVTYFIEQHAEIDIETTNKLLFMAKEYQYPDLAMLLFKKEADLIKDSHIEKRKSQEPNLESTNEIKEVKKQKGSDDELIEQGKGKKRKYNDLIADAEENKDEVAETKDKQHPNKKARSDLRQSRGPRLFQSQRVKIEETTTEVEEEKPGIT